jgi:peptidoglycan hydrolase-like protein with peptidoglycan-binding domain
MTRRRVLQISLAAVAVLAVAGGAALAIRAAATPASEEASPPGGELATERVERRTIHLTDELDGTLGYADTYGVVSLASGVVTSLPEEGATIKSGDVLFELDGDRPVVMLEGEVPAWRAFADGMADGPDVQQLEAALVKLGFAPADLVADEIWDDDTTAAVEAWQESLDLDDTGKIARGQIVFEPESLRVAAVKATLGSPVAVGSPILTATSTKRQVSVDLEADRQTIVSLGAKVNVALPDDTEAAGTITDIGTVAVVRATPADPNADPTITVTIEFDDPATSGTLDGAPVTVEIVRESHANVLVVPIDSLLALTEGGFAVEVVDASGKTHLVGVETGFFDEHLVEVTSAELAEGMNVVVPS